jgi:methyl-accepting chemotaxis protein
MTSNIYLGQRLLNLSVCPPLCIHLDSCHQQADSICDQPAYRILNDDLSNTLATHFEDKMETLSKGIDQMRESLASILEGVRVSAFNTAIDTKEMMSGNQTLVSYTGAQTSTLAQVPEPIRQKTVRTGNDLGSAGSADSLASGYAAHADRKGQVDSQAVETMLDIQNSSKKVADIISVISCTPLQTNIAAVNTAFEVARAGKLSRAFSVFAAEVRALVKRNSDEAHQITVLIGDSVEKVEIGSAFVNEADANMASIVFSTVNASQTVQEVSEANNSLLFGIDEITNAVAALENSTRTSSSIVEAAVFSLKKLTLLPEKLLLSIYTFKLDIKLNVSDLLASSSSSSEIKSSQKLILLGSIGTY